MSDPSSDTPCFHARAVFIDFEDTLILKRPNGGGKHSIHDSMIELLAHAKGMDKKEAERLVKEALDEQHRPMEEVCAKLGIELRALRAEIMGWLPDMHTADPEARKTLDHFRQIGLKMWPATTNSGFLCSLKLEAVGLGDASGNPYFEELLGGSEVHPLGKSTAGFFKNLLQRSGVEPGEVLHWRQESLLATQPVAEFDLAGLNIDHITGTELRNPRDEHLGTVDNVLVAPDGTILYLIVSRGGFLGLGEEHIAIPWNGLQATPGMNMFVLDVDETVIEQAPRVDPDRFVLPEVFEQRQQEIDQYWQQHMAS